MEPSTVLLDRSETNIQTLPVTKHQRDLRYTVVPTDRVALLQQANRLVELMVYKQTAGASSTIPEIHELSTEETRALRSALCYLERTFEMGARDAEVHRCKEEVTYEFGAKPA